MRKGDRVAIPVTGLGSSSRRPYQPQLHAPGNGSGGLQQQQEQPAARLHDAGTSWDAALQLLDPAAPAPPPDRQQQESMRQSGWEQDESGWEQDEAPGNAGTAAHAGQRAAQGAQAGSRPRSANGNGTQASAEGLRKRARLGKEGPAATSLAPVRLPAFNIERLAQLDQVRSFWAVQAMLHSAVLHAVSCDCTCQTRDDVVETPLPVLAAPQEILDFARRVAPTQTETSTRDAAFERARAACKAANMYAHVPWQSASHATDVPGITLYLPCSIPSKAWTVKCRHELRAFGSRANGLELWNSDIDVVVLGVKEPHGPNGGARCCHSDCCC
jgi:hypothetical protein